MAHVDEHFRAWPRMLGEGVRHAPVGNIGVIERWLERLVFDEHLHRRGHRVMHFTQRFHAPTLAPCDVPLSGIVGSVGKPHHQRARVHRLRELDRMQEMRDRGATHRWIFVGHRTKSIALALEQIWIHAANAQSACARGGNQLARTTRRAIPQRMNRHARTRTSESMHLRCIIELVVNRQCRRVLQELAKARPRVGETP